MDINKMMTEDEIDAKFQALNLPNDGLTPRDLSAAEKYSQIVDFQKRKDENEKRNVERNKPSHFVDLLREDKMRGIATSSCLVDHHHDGNLCLLQRFRLEANQVQHDECPLAARVPRPQWPRPPLLCPRQADPQS